MTTIRAAALLAGLLFATSALAQGPGGAPGGGPGPAPQPWRINGSAISYDGCVLVPAAVTGGCKGNGTLNVKQLFTTASAVGGAGLNIGQGVAPTSPVNGDVWIDSTGMFARAGGVTYGPFIGGSGGSFAGTSPITVSFPAGVVTYAFNFSIANTWLAQQTAQGATTTSPGWYAQIAGDTVPRVRVGLNGSDVPSIAFGPGSGNRDTFIERLGAASIRFGSPDVASPVAQTISVQNVVAGTSNTAGANWTLAGSRGTGSGAGGAIIFQTAPAGGSGTSQNALAVAMTINSSGGITLGSPTGGDQGAGKLNAVGLYVGGVAVITGNQSITLSGDVTGSGSTAITTTIAANAVTYAKFQQVAAVSLVGNPTGSLANASGITLDATLSFSGTTLKCNTFSATINGCVPTPGAATGKLLSDNGTWITVAGTGTVTSISPGNGLTSTLTATAPGSAITGTGTLSSAVLVNAQTGTTYAIVDGDRAKLITATNAAAQAYSLAQAGAASAFQAGWLTRIQNNSTSAAGIVTITPTTSTINGAATYKVQPGQSAMIVSDGTNYQVYSSSNARQLPGTTTNDDANAGNIGEHPNAEVLIGSAVPMTTATATAIASISLSPGDWDVNGNFCSNPNTATSTAVLVTINTAVALPTAPNKGAYVLWQGSTASLICQPSGTMRQSLSVTTTVYLIGYVAFTGTSMGGYGYIQARRVR